MIADAYLQVELRRTVRLADSFSKPVRVRFPAGVAIASIPADVMPFDSALAIDTTGHVWGSGFNYGGELCLGSVKAYSRPVRLPFANVTAVAGAAEHVIYDARHRLYMCGTKLYGELGNGTTGVDPSPVQFIPLPTSKYKSDSRSRKSVDLQIMPTVLTQAISRSLL